MPDIDKVKPLPPLSELVELFVYLPETGELLHKHRKRERFNTEREWKRWNTRYSEKIAGSIDKHGYRVVGIDYSYFKIHRIIWKFETGEDPCECIDHKDGNTSNNRFSNLRDVSLEINARNAAKQVNNISGFTGVSFKTETRKWVAQVYDKRNRKHLGYHNTPQEANQAIVDWREGRGYTDRHGV